MLSEADRDRRAGDDHRSAGVLHRLDDRVVDGGPAPTPLGSGRSSGASSRSRSRARRARRGTARRSRRRSRTSARGRRGRSSGSRRPRRGAASGRPGASRTRTAGSRARRAAPSRVSSSMLGPPASPCDWKMASTPVRCVVTPAGHVGGDRLPRLLDRQNGREGRLAGRVDQREHRLPVGRDEGVVVRREPRARPRPRIHGCAGRDRLLDPGLLANVPVRDLNTATSGYCRPVPNVSSVR